MTKRTCFAALAAFCVSFAFFSCSHALSSKTTTLSFSFSGDNIRAATGAQGGGRSAVSRVANDDDERATLTVTLSGGGYSATQTVGFTASEWYGFDSEDEQGNRNIPTRQVPFSNVPVGVPITIRASFLNPWDRNGDPDEPYTGEETVTLSGDASVNIQLRRVRLSDGSVDYDYPISGGSF